MYFTIFQNMGFRKYEFTHNFSGDVQVPVCSLAHLRVFSGPSAVWLQCAALPQYRELCSCLQHCSTQPRNQTWIYQNSLQYVVLATSHLHLHFTHTSMVSDVTGSAGVTGRYLAKAIISDKSK